MVEKPVVVMHIDTQGGVRIELDITPNHAPEDLVTTVAAEAVPPLRDVEYRERLIARYGG